MSLLIVLLAAMVAGEPSQAVPAAVDRGLEMMQRVPDLEGRWEGGGAIRMGEGDPVPFVGEEIVESRLDGRLLLVEGKHYSPDRSRVVHHAFAVLAWDEARGGYRFRTHLNNGRGGDFPARVEDGALIWEIDSPQGRMQYHITITGDEWHEVGRIERAGKWYDFFEMKLRRISK